MKIIGITGSIGCGKTTLAKIAQGLGYAVYFVDEATRSLYYQKEFIDIIAQNFHNVVENGRVNKRALRNIVFDDNQQLKKLEALIHPFLKKNLKKMIRKNCKSAELFFVDVALLLEMGWDKYVDLILLADVEPEIQKKRVMIRDKISAEDFEKINNIQMDNRVKADWADIIINTDQPKNLLRLELINVTKGMSW